MQPTEGIVNSKAFFKYVRNKKRLKENSSFIRWKGKVIVDHTCQRGAHIFFFFGKNGIELGNGNSDRQYSLGGR